jgi:hypothetical protein
MLGKFNMHISLNNFIPQIEQHFPQMKLPTFIFGFMKYFTRMDDADKKLGISSQQVCHCF